MKIKGILFDKDAVIKWEEIPLIIANMKAIGIIMGVVTDENADATESFLQSIGLDKYISHISASDGIMPPKPNPMRIWNFCDKYGFKPSEVMVVGTTQTDIDFAKKADAIAVGVNFAGKPKKTFLDADYVVEKKSDILDYII